MDINTLLKALDNEDNSHLLNLTNKKIKTMKMEILKELENVSYVAPESGVLACGDVGIGKFPKIENIKKAIYVLFVDGLFIYTANQTLGFNFIDFIFIYNSCSNKSKRRSGR